jgi:dTDP-4-amino-4,6-dideoxygalactose transaminase
MSQLQAAALTPQVAKLDPRNAIRQERVRGFIHKLRGVGGLRCTLDPRIESAFYKVPLLLEDASASRDAFIAWSNEEGIDLGESFRGFGLRSPRRCRKIGDLPNSRSLSQRTCLLHHPVFLAAEPVVDELCRRLANIAIRSRKTV